jgi:hypothetical protein
VLAITGNATDKWSSKKRGSTGPMRS